MGFFNVFSEKDKAFFTERHCRCRDDVILAYRRFGRSDLVERIKKERVFSSWEWLVIEDVWRYFVHGKFGETEDDAQQYLRMHNKTFQVTDQESAIIETVIAAGTEVHRRYTEDLEKRIALLSAENQALRQSLAKKEETPAVEIHTEEYLLEQRRQLRADCEAMMADYYSQCKAQAGEVDRLHTQMCEKTNAMQTALAGCLDESLAVLTAMKYELFEHLRTWQNHVCGGEYRAIALCYRELYRIVNLDKMITGAVFAVEQNGPDGVFDETIASLLRLEKTLTTFLHKFERALVDLGLYIYYPAAGEAWNEVKHTCEEECLEGAVITECLLPGVAYKKGSDDDGEILFPAYVKIMRDENKKKEITADVTKAV